MSDFTDEDRERVEGVRLQAEIDAKHFRKIGHRLVAERKEQDDSALTRALAHIDHVEEALASLADEFDHIRVAVELERDEAADDENWRWAARLDGVVATWLHAAELARAALKGDENG